MRIRKIFIGAIAFLATVVVLGNSAYAYSAIEQKALGYGVYRCYADGDSSSSHGGVVRGPIGLNSTYLNYETVITDKDESGHIKLPNLASFDVDNYAVSCVDLFTRNESNKNFEGLLTQNGFAVAGYSTDLDLTRSNDQVKFLEAMGYKNFAEDFGQECLRYQAYYRDGNVVKSASQLCPSSGDYIAKAESVGGRYEMTADESHLVSFATDKNELLVCAFPYGNSNGWDCSFETYRRGDYDKTNDVEVKVYDLNKYKEKTFEDLAGDVKSEVSRILDGKDHVTFDEIKDLPGQGPFWIKKYLYASGGESSISGEYSLADPSDEITTGYYYDAAKTVINNLLGMNISVIPNDLRFTANEKYDLYRTYLVEQYEVGYTCEGGTESDGWRKVPWFYGDSGMQECFIKIGDDVDKDLKVHGLNYLNEFTGEDKTFDEIVDGLIEAANTEGFDPSGTPSAPDPGIPDPNDPNGSQPSCYDGSGPLGWILCPVIESVSTIGTTMWKSIEENHLQVPAGEIFGNNSGVRDAWGIIRDIANVLFIVLFLVVIFSQLTGVGIDNYGIKKILPRLIVVAVLINLSYIICELAIDLSNILGNGLNSILSDAADGVASGNGASLGSKIGGWIFTAALGTGVGAGAALFAFLNPAGALVGAASLGLAVLGVVITIVVALLVLYAIVVARSAGIILLTVLAPAAIVCYALPNTEKLAKKWFDIFKALLVVYPICGAMVGAGRMAGAVLAGVNNGSMKVAAMVVQVLPFFLIPTLLKSSLALMGNLGAKISNLGRQGKQLGARGFAKAQGAVKGTEQFKNWSQYQQEKTAANRAGRVQARLRNRMASGKTLSARDQDRLRRADDTVLAWKSREAINDRRTSEQSYAARQAAIATEDEKARVADYESLIENGRAYNNSGSLINVNDPNSVGTYHAEALARYEAATNDAERSEAMSQIKAAQNILSKTDKGRAQVQNNLAAALQAGRVSGLSGASAHLMSNFGDTYKNKNRGAHEMIRDLATTDLSKSAELTGLQSKLTNGDYAFAGTKSYTAETLAGADDAALDKFVDGVTNGSLTGNELANIQDTAYEALQKAKGGTLNIKPEVSQKLEQIVGNNYVPKAVPNDRATILSHGAYEFYDGTVVHLRELSNGKYLDDAGNETDIRFYKRKL